MNPQTHFLFSFLLATLFVKINIISWNIAFFIGIATILFDLDHYIEHILHSKKYPFSLSDTWNNSEKFHRFKQRSFLHHFSGFFIITILFVIFLFIKAQWALILALIYYPHIFLDYVRLRKESYFRKKIGIFYVQETPFELFLDCVLLLLFIIIFFI